jgi:hypothetical protein
MSLVFGKSLGMTGAAELFVLGIVRFGGDWTGIEESVLDTLALPDFEVGTDGLRNLVEILGLICIERAGA